MNRQGHQAVKFFVGTEVEHTPAHGRTTLFVIGIQDINQIQRLIDNYHAPIDHIYFGANQSFDSPTLGDANAVWPSWRWMIKHFLDKGMLCTLDCPVGCAAGLANTELVDYHNFIPMLSVKLPNIKKLGYNATLKLDDKDFAATNPGVWCHSLHDLQNRRAFTDWSKYSQDKVLK